MQKSSRNSSSRGKVSLGCLWLLGVPVPILIIFFSFEAAQGIKSGEHRHHDGRLNGPSRVGEVALSWLAVG
jgi:hypothetical protein